MQQIMFIQLGGSRFFFIHIEVNSGEEGTEIEALAGEVPLDCTQNQEDDNAQQDGNLNIRCSREEITDQQPITVTR